MIGVWVCLEGNAVFELAACANDWVFFNLMLFLNSNSFSFATFFLSAHLSAIELCEPEQFMHFLSGLLHLSCLWLLLEHSLQTIAFGVGQVEVLWFNW